MGNKVQGIMGKAKRKRASAPVYVSPNQLTLEGFQTPFDKQLAKDNRWVVLANLIPWDEVCAIYLKHIGLSSTGRPAISPLVVIGSLIIKHLGNLDDREAVEQIRENMYMQYFLGYSSFTTAQPFDPTLFVEFRKRLGTNNLKAINDKIIALKTKLEVLKTDSKPFDPNQKPTDHNSGSENRGRVIFDATACPQDIAYPTDLNLLSDAREKAEHLIDILYDPELYRKKPRTYRKVARRRYLHVAQKKNKSRKEIRKANGSQLGLLRRDLNLINRLLSAYTKILLDKKEHMMDYVERYHARFGCYPRELLADKIYCTHTNRAALKEKGIKLLEKPLGRPSAVLKHVSPGERNPIEGKFGQAKTTYGLDPIRTRLRETSESWIVCIFLVLNLIKLAGVALTCLLLKMIMFFSAKAIEKSILRSTDEIYNQIILPAVLSNPGRIGIKIFC